MHKVYNVGQMLVCDRETCGVITSVYQMYDGRCLYTIDFSDQNINDSFRGARWDQEDVDHWYLKYLDILQESK